MMKTHAFTIIIDTNLDDDLVDKLYALMDDATVCSIAGVARIGIDREATGLEDAISSALGQISDLGLHALRVELEPESLLVA
jgi:hypothetical protein